MKKLIFFLNGLLNLFALAAAFLYATTSVAASIAPVVAPHGMVVSAHHLASDVGVAVLKSGGNAIDAAVAVGYALSVVYPAAGNLGGGGFMTIRFADGRTTFLDFREKAPLAANANMYLDKQGRVIKGLSTKGYLAVGVPGSVAGLEYARQHFGTRSRSALINPAIGLAEKGFVLEQGDADLLAEGADDLKKDPPSAKVFFPKGQLVAAGERLIQKDLAQTLKRIRTQGTDGFYRGATAAALVAAMRTNQGLITLQDLQEYRVRELPPISCNYRGYQIISAPPPSSGGVVICEVLNILEGYALGDMGFHSAAAMHYQIEAMRHAYADRNNYLGDPDFVHNPIDRLTSKDYAAQIRGQIDPNRAGISKDISSGISAHEGSNTTHYSIVDQQGNMVGVTYTLNDWFGAKVMPAGTGVLLNDEMDDFTSKVGEANLYGLVQGEANAIAPGKRPLSSMSPTIVAKDGRPVMVLGTPGGSRIITAVLMVLINCIDYSMNIQEAVDAPRFHQQWLPEATNLERFTVSEDTLAILKNMGHKFSAPQPANHMAAIMVNAPSLTGQSIGANRYYGAIDPRRSTGLVKGY